jgi:hypothetical protein
LIDRATREIEKVLSLGLWRHLLRRRTPAGAREGGFAMNIMGHELPTRSVLIAVTVSLLLIGAWLVLG